MNTNPARGMRDFLPEDVQRRHYVIGVIADVYQRYGFEPLETPAVENIETLLGKYGEEGDKLIFKILKRGEGAETGQADLALRYDLTVPLARVVAEHRAKLPKFFKRYQVQPVWRADRPQKGRFREFYQCDVDAIGSKSMVVEAELLAAASDVLSRLGFSDFKIRVNHRKLLRALLDEKQIPPEAQTDFLVAGDKLDKVGFAGVRKELFDKGYPAGKVDPWIGWLEEKWGFDRFIQVLGPKASDEVRLAWQDNADEGLRELSALFSLAKAAGIGDRLEFDFGLVRGLSYYTGSIFEIAVPDLAGSLAGGGRYDNLIGMFSGEDIPACGISLGLERILVVMGERGMFPPTLATTAADVMVTLWNAARTTEALALAGELRAAGLRVEVYPEADKLGRQFKYASTRGIPFVAIMGDEEMTKGEVAIKNLSTGEQISLARAEVAAHLKRLT